MLIRRRDKSNVKAVSYSIFELFGVIVKFKLKLFTTDKNKIEKPIASEYLMNSNTSITINTNACIEVTLKSKEDSKYFYLNEVSRVRLVRKLQKLVNALELYECKEIDLLTITSSGTKLRSEIAQPISIAIGNQTAIFTPYFDEQYSTVNIAITYDTVTCAMSTNAFLLLIQKLKDFDYDNMTMQLINYYNTYNENTIAQYDPAVIAKDDNNELPKSTLTKPFESDIMSIANEEKPPVLKSTNVKIFW